MYTDRKTAPLAFHKFNMYLSLPLSILLYASSLIFGIDVGSTVGIMSSSCLLLLKVASLVGFIKWRDYGFVCFLISSALSVALMLILPSVDSHYLFYDGSVSVFSTIIGGIIYLICLVSYYEKRMLLFGGEAVTNKCQNAKFNSCEEPPETMAKSLEQDALAPEDGDLLVCADSVILNYPPS